MTYKKSSKRKSNKKRYSLVERISHYQRIDSGFTDRFRSSKDAAFTEKEFRKYLNAYKKNRKAQYASGYLKGARGAIHSGDTIFEKKGYEAGKKALIKSREIKF